MSTLAISHGNLAALLAAKNALEDPRTLWAVGIFIGVLLLGAAVLALVERWRKKQISDYKGEKDPLTTYREMYRRGELSKEEYAKIRQKLAAQYLDIGGKKPSDGDDGSAPEGDKPPPAQA